MLRFFSYPLLFLSAFQHVVLVNSAARPRIESALFVCGYALFKHEEIAMLFPPTDISMNDIQNVTHAEHIHRQSIDSFCKQVKTYTSCVKKNLFYFPEDNLLKLYLDLDNFERYFEFFCKNSKLIAEQFQCTRISVMRTTCPFSGVYGIIAQVSRMIRRPMSRKEFCARVRYSTNCRVNFQLAPCHGRYANIMKWIYQRLVSNYCE